MPRLCLIELQHLKESGINYGAFEAILGMYLHLASIIQTCTGRTFVIHLKDTVHIVWSFGNCNNMLVKNRLCMVRVTVLLDYFDLWFFFM